MDGGPMNGIELKLHALSKGGTHDISNIQPFCWLCNRNKNVRYREFRPERLLGASFTQK